MKAAVYAGTRNVYKDMIPSMKSLLIHSDVERIYFLIEDDEFPYELPPEVECINISNQTWFPENGPNMKNRCSYMVLLRAAFPKIFPHLDTILTIDNDTIVRENISELWEIPIENYYLAGCAEPKKTRNNFLYINMGLALINLKKMREDKIDDKLIEELNTHYFFEAEQSAINLICQGKILEISSIYNDNNYTKKNNHKQKIVHYAAIKGWQDFPIIQKYRDIEIKRNIPDNFKLDIIIPSYKDPEGLEVTLKSIYYEDLPIQITVIDDNSDFDLIELAEIYPKVNFVRLDENCGPGAVRQYGIEYTFNPYLMFIDCGDYIFSKICLIDILNTIEKYSKYYIFSWNWIDEESSHFFNNEKELLPGKVFKREFLELYNLKFNVSKECSYSNEDRGFLSSCNLVLLNIKLYETTPYFYASELPIYFRVFNKNSLTHDKDFYTKKHIQGYSYNMVHMAKICESNQINKVLLAQKLHLAMLTLYELYLQSTKKDPTTAKENLEAIKFFYQNSYKTYEIIDNISSLPPTYIKRLRPFISSINPCVNINRFIEQLKN